MGHDPQAALRLAVALAPWWLLRGRLPAHYPLLREVADQTVAGSDEWAIAQFWLGYAAIHSANPARAVDHFTAVCNAVGDRPPTRALADCLSRRSRAFAELGQTAEAVEDGHRSLALSRDVDYPAGEVVALMNLGVAALYAGNDGDAVQLIRQAGQIQADIPGWIARPSEPLSPHSATKPAPNGPARAARRRPDGPRPDSRR